MFQRIHAPRGSCLQAFQRCLNNQRASRSHFKTGLCWTSFTSITSFKNQLLKGSKGVAYFSYSWVVLGTSFGSLLSSFGIHLASIGHPVGSMWALWAPFGLHLGSLGSHLGSIGPLWGHFWTSRGQKGRPKGSLV